MNNNKCNRKEDNNQSEFEHKSFYFIIKKKLFNSLNPEFSKVKKMIYKLNNIHELAGLFTFNNKVLRGAAEGVAQIVARNPIFPEL